MGLFKRTKNNKRPLLRQIIDLIPPHILADCIARHKSDKYCSRYRTRDQLVAQMFEQSNNCYPLEDISAGIAVNKTYIAELGLNQSPARSTMSGGNAKRHWKVFKSLYTRLLGHYASVLKVKHQSTIIEEVKHKTVKLVDSMTISLCLSLISWAKFRTAKGGLKIHTCWDDSLALPEIFTINKTRQIGPQLRWVSSQ